MKKIEITNLIDEKLSRNKLEFYDLLNQTHYIDSYEKYIQEFNLIKNTFKNNIQEFADIADDYLSRMENLVNQCKSLNDEEIKDYIERNIFNNIIKTSYNTRTPLRITFPTSLNNNLERSTSTINQVYKELGYDSLMDYIELLKSPSYFSTYLSSSEKQTVAMHYMLYKTDHHSPTKFKRNTNSANLYTQMETNINNSIKEVVEEKDKYIDFMNDEKEKMESWQNEHKQKCQEFMDTSNASYNKFMESCYTKLDDLEKTYSEKLKVEKPAKFMLDKSKEYERKTILWVILDVIVSGLLISLLGIILNPNIQFSKKVISINLFNGDLPIYSSIIILAMICLIIYVLRIMIKITMSSKHLSEEYKQKYILAYFYLSLINDGKIEEKIGQTILTLLFSKADTGLIKNDSGSEYESIVKMLTSSGK